MLLKLIGRYRNEAEKAAKARAYYAACITLGAAFEGLLLAMCCMREDDVETYIAKLDPKNRPPKKVERWDLHHMLPVATAFQWLPARANKHSRTRLAEWARLIQELRNLVHPGMHIREYPNLKVTKGNWRDAQSIFELSLSSIEDLVHSDLRAEMRKRGFIPLS